MKEEKIIIVEGRSDKKHIERVIAEPVTILCTYGTFSIEYFDELLEKYYLYDQDVYIFVDEDDAGLQLRKQLAQELSHAKHIHVKSESREVETAPLQEVAYALLSQNIEVDVRFL